MATILRWLRSVFMLPDERRRRAEWKQDDDDWRRESMRLWQEQGCRLAEKHRAHMADMYSMNPSFAAYLFGYPTFAEALESEAVLKQFEQQCAGEWIDG